MKTLKLWSYKVTVVHALQACDPANRTEGQSVQNRHPYESRVKGKYRKRNLDVPQDELISEYSNYLNEIESFCRPCHGSSG
jgi:hypothetical protein